MSNSSIWPIDRTIPGAATPGQSGLGSDGKEGVLRILQNSSITGALPSNCLMSYPGYLESDSFAEMQLASLRNIVMTKYEGYLIKKVNFDLGVGNRKYGILLHLL